eukprot:scaffold5382_cov114-Isochrysis_galbana.AAC.15
MWQPRISVGSPSRAMWQPRISVGWCGRHLASRGRTSAIRMQTWMRHRFGTPRWRPIGNIGPHKLVWMRRDLRSRSVWRRLG